MEAVGTIDVSMSRGSEHRCVPRSEAGVAVTGRVVLVVGLHLNYSPSDAIDQQQGAEKIGRDLEGWAGKEGSLDGLHSGQASNPCRPSGVVAIPSEKERLWPH